jgi:hypothetical protein
MAMAYLYLLGQRLSACFSQARRLLNRRLPLNEAPRELAHAFFDQEVKNDSSKNSRDYS